MFTLTRVRVVLMSDLLLCVCVCVCSQVRDAAADELVAKCPMGVFDIEDLGGACTSLVSLPSPSSSTHTHTLIHANPHARSLLAGGGKRAVVARSRNCSLCRECIRESAWADRVALLRVSDHFICTFSRLLLASLLGFIDGASRKCIPPNVSNIDARNFMTICFDFTN